MHIQLFNIDEFRTYSSKKGENELIYAKDVKSSKISIDDFDLIKVLGRGAFGKVNN